MVYPPSTLKERWATFVVIVLYCLLIWWNGQHNYQKGRKDGIFWGAVGYHNYVIRKMHEEDKDSLSSDDLFEVFKQAMEEHE